MYHFDLPYCLEEKGGWLNRDTIEAFVEYAKVLFIHYGSKVKYWLTINEQNTMILHPGAIGLPKVGKLPSKKRFVSTKPPYDACSGKSHETLP